MDFERGWKCKCDTNLISVQLILIKVLSFFLTELSSLVFC